jgi:hypothetical protein
MACRGFAVGIACLAAFAAGCAEQEKPSLTPEENALAMQCDQKHGTLAMAHGSHGEWVSCYIKNAKKKLWSVKL